MASRTIEPVLADSCASISDEVTELDAPIVLSQEPDPMPSPMSNGLAVLMVVDGLFPAVGGAELQAIKLATALRERGTEVEFLAPLLEPESQSETSINGIPLTRIAYPKVRGLGAIMLNLKFLTYLVRNQNRFDAVHFHTMGTLTATAGIFRRFLNLSLISKVSGYYEFTDGVLRKGGRFNPVHQLMKWGIRRIDYVQTISEQTRERLLESGFSNKQIKHIPNGVESRIKRVRPQTANGTANSVANDERTRVIGYAGRVRKVKGVSVLVDAFHQYCVRNPSANVRLEIAGDGDQMEEIQAKVAELGLVKRIRFLGFVENVNEFLSQLDIYVQPSFAEGLPNSVIEAMNISLPILATDIGGNRDLVEPGVNGDLFPAGDSDALANKLETFLADPAGLQKMGEMSRLQVVDKFGFDTVAEKLLALYSPISSD